MTRGRVDTYVKTQKASHQKIIQRLRRLVKRAAPSLREELKWGNPCYILGDKENVCYIYVASDHVNLAFFRGAKLEDPRKRLEGTGKAMRHIKERDTANIDDKAITQLVRQAVTLQTKATNRSG